MIQESFSASAAASSPSLFEAVAAALDVVEQGPGRLLFAPDLVGTSEELAEQLAAHAAFREVDEVAFKEMLRAALAS